MDSAAPRRDDSLRDSLWNESALAHYDGDQRAYQAAILEQYKLYAEMADRISQRRGLTNTFFLSVNTAIFTVVSVFWKENPKVEAGWLLLPLTVALAQCFAWFYLVRSYRLLNGAKYVVLGLLEERLPASPYWRAEWSALGQGKDWRKYWPLTHIEQWVPVLFAAVYLAAFVAVAAV